MRSSSFILTLDLFNSFTSKVFSLRDGDIWAAETAEGADEEETVDGSGIGAVDGADGGGGGGADNDKCWDITAESSISLFDSIWVSPSWMSFGEGGGGFVGRWDLLRATNNHKQRVIDSVNMCSPTNL
jgi:hypothetical protein